MPAGGGGAADMRTIRILHAADLHLDSAFVGLPARKAALRRGGSPMNLPMLCSGSMPSTECTAPVMPRSLI